MSLEFYCLPFNGLTIGVAAAENVTSQSPVPNLDKVARIYTMCLDNTPPDDLALFNMGLCVQEVHKSSEASGNL